MPGKVYERFNLLAQGRSAAEEDLDLCDALADPRLRRHGRGFVVDVVLEIADIERLMDWIGDDQPKFLRDYRDRVRAAIRAR